MPIKVEFSDRQPEYRYMPISNEMADVFIYKFVEEKVNEEDGSTSFIYELNEFRIDQNEITEDMISADPMAYLTYRVENTNIAIEERVSAIEEAVIELAEVVFNG